MDAHALLTTQGWRGKGHSLHITDDSIGLAKPLLLSRNDDTKGLGTKQHFTSDQWWMNAFDEQLKGLDTSKEGRVQQTVTTGKLNSIEKGSLGKYYLYTSFVRGGFLEGTLGDEKDSSTDSDEATPNTDEPEPRRETKEERRARKEARRKRKEERAKVRAARRERKAKASKSEPSSDADEEKRRRRAKKEEKRRKRKEKEAK
ncbi:hypothetical protein TOPH_04065 [Tolypocladium ophioglossoides CBS 100239]|uniref:Protein TMA23 n=1 Tax=Tolypocladium ophioglossoides (strain CBS 100239) TaxID=1163406 RepID=A0A0L0NAW3_TOLOC|nr:hypothetical protein TOPH_04065 [Tolypocladium ophioglossoides CBS 100239]